MEAQAYLEKMKNLQISLLTYLANKKDMEENLQNIIKLFNGYKIKEAPMDFKLFLRMISQISANNQHLPNYFTKIKSVINQLKDQIKQTFSNLEIFEIFRQNNRLLLFLIEDKIIQFDEPFIVQIKKKYSLSHYLPFFYPELKPFLSEKEIEEYSKQITENFEEKRKVGENDDFICGLIRNDDLDKFIAYVKENNIQINSKMKSSIFETNHFIELKSLPTTGSSTPIEYAAYFGSIKIFKYLFSQQVQMNPKLLTFSIHGANMEIIKMLEKNKSLFEEQKRKKRFTHFSSLYSDDDDIFSYDMYDLLHWNSKRTIQEQCLIEAIISHQNEIAKYVFKKWIKKKDVSLFVSKSFKSFNFLFIEEYFKNDDTFYYLCKNDYYTLASLFMKTQKINVSKKAIQKVIF